jgi:hypothetical protein
MVSPTSRIMKLTTVISSRPPTCRSGFSEESRISREINEAALCRAAATLPRLITSSLLLVALSGCQSGNYNHYTAPEVTGRVLSADTHQPIANVRVFRSGENNNFEPFGPPKGGTLIIQPAPVMTDADGRFLLESKSVFALFRNAGWWTAPVTCQHAGYETFSTNYTASNVISNTPTGAPVVDAGDILLQPAPR